MIRYRLALYAFGVERNEDTMSDASMAARPSVSRRDQDFAMFEQMWAAAVPKPRIPGERSFIPLEGEDGLDAIARVTGAPASTAREFRNRAMRWRWIRSDGRRVTSLLKSPAIIRAERARSSAGPSSAPSGRRGDGKNARSFLRRLEREADGRPMSFSAMWRYAVVVQKIDDTVMEDLLIAYQTLGLMAWTNGSDMEGGITFMTSHERCPDCTVADLIGRVAAGERLPDPPEPSSTDVAEASSAPSFEGAAAPTPRETGLTESMLPAAVSGPQRVGAGRRSRANAEAAARLLAEGLADMLAVLYANRVQGPRSYIVRRPWRVLRGHEPFACLISREIDEALDSMVEQGMIRLSGNRHEALFLTRPVMPASSVADAPAATMNSRALAARIPEPSVPPPAQESSPLERLTADQRRYFDILWDARARSNPRYDGQPTIESAVRILAKGSELTNVGADEQIAELVRLGCLQQATAVKLGASALRTVHIFLVNPEAAAHDASVASTAVLNERRRIAGIDRALATDRAELARVQSDIQAAEARLSELRAEERTVRTRIERLTAERNGPLTT